MPGIRSNVKGVQMHDLDDDDEYLLGLIPECHDLFQCLNHAYAYGTNSCYYLICSHLRLMYIVRHSFSKDLLESYAAVTDWLYGQTFAQFYVPGNDVPIMSPLIEEAFSDKRFPKLKMTPHTFQCYLGLWQAININPPRSNSRYHIWYGSLHG